MIQQKSCVWEASKAGAIEREFRRVSEVKKDSKWKRKFLFFVVRFCVRRIGADVLIIRAAQLCVLHRQRLRIWIKSCPQIISALRSDFWREIFPERQTRGERGKELNWSKAISIFICKSVCCYLFFSLAVASLHIGSLDEFHGNLYWHISIISKLYNGACNFLLRINFCFSWKQHATTSRHPTWFLVNREAFLLTIQRLTGSCIRNNEDNRHANAADKAGRALWNQKPENFLCQICCDENPLNTRLSFISCFCFAD